MDANRRKELTRDVINELAKIFSPWNQKKNHPERDYLGDSWLANMHLCYTNDYISFKTLYENEIEDILCEYAKDGLDRDYCRVITNDLEDLICSTSHLLSDVTYEKVGIMLENSIVRGAYV
jgi:hypothetical protein